MKDFELHYSDKSVSPWGGMALMKNVLDKTGIKGKMQELDLPKPGSNRGFKPEEIMEAFWVSIWCGASRFAHSDYLRYDKTLTQIFGWKQAPSQSTYSRFFHKFDMKRSDSVFKELNRWFFEQWKIDNITLDVDSSVLTRYGNQQQGANKGYNPHKPGRNSHHPLMAFISEGG
jgi:Transposase DDE domain group 1